MSEKVIGFAVEPRLYKVGKYILKQVPGTERTLDEPDPTMEVLSLLQLTDPKAIMNKTIVRFWDELEKTGRVKKALLKVLQFNDDPGDGATLEQVVGMITRQGAGEVLKDFFWMNFASMQQSGNTAGSTTLI